MNIKFMVNNSAIKIKLKIEINDWPVSTRKHTQKGGHYVFKSGDNKSSF